MRMLLLLALVISYNIQRLYLVVANSVVPADPEKVARKRRAKRENLDSDAAWSVALDVRRIADECGALLFPSSGTLLGLQRHGRILKHDVDIDYGIFESDPRLGEFLARLKANENCAKSMATRLGFWARMLNPWVPKLPDNVIVHKFNWRVPGKSDQTVPVDVFIHFHALGFVAHGIWNRMWLNTDLNLKRVTFGDTDFCAPGDVGRYLTENYGDYKTERKDFEITVDCPNCVMLYVPSSIVNFLRLQHVYSRAGWHQRSVLLHEKYEDMVRQLWRGPNAPPEWKIRPVGYEGK